MLRCRAFLLHMSIAWDRTFYVVPNSIYIVTLTFRFDLLLINFNLSCYLMMVAVLQAPLSSDNSCYLLQLCTRLPVSETS